MEVQVATDKELPSTLQQPPNVHWPYCASPLHSVRSSRFLQAAQDTGSIAIDPHPLVTTSIYFPLGPMFRVERAVIPGLGLPVVKYGPCFFLELVCPSRLPPTPIPQLTLGNPASCARLFTCYNAYSSASGTLLSWKLQVAHPTLNDSCHLG